jgi:hypothetical protein
MLIKLFGVWFIAGNIAFLDPDNGRDQYNRGYMLYTHDIRRHDKHPFR